MEKQNAEEKNTSKNNTIERGQKKVHEATNLSLGNSIVQLSPKATKVKPEKFNCVFPLLYILQCPNLVLQNLQH